MRKVIGTDEAGYGPNLGPLVIAATKWQLPDDVDDMRKALQDVVVEIAGNPDDSRIEVADSKQLYTRGHGLARLERAVAAFAALNGGAAKSFTEFVLDDCSCQLDCLDDLYCSINQFSFPQEVAAEQVGRDAERLGRQMEKCGIQFQQLAVRVVFPDRFNRLLDRRENKANLLSQETLCLVAELMDPGESHQILCDKHGGRSRYLGLIQHCLTLNPARIECEGRQRSAYHWQDSNEDNSIEFVAGGEFHLPIALASMAAKYVREQFMNAWNSFWLQQIPQLKPTAGYPVDARRFKADIAQKQVELGIEDSQIWRLK